MFFGQRVRYRKLWGGIRRHGFVQCHEPAIRQVGWADSFLGQSGSLPAWNFGKYLVGKDGKVVAYYPSKVAPEAKELREAIEAALAK